MLMMLAMSAGFLEEGASSCLADTGETGCVCHHNAGCVWLMLMRLAMSAAFRTLMLMMLTVSAPADAHDAGRVCELL